MWMCVFCSQCALRWRRSWRVLWTSHLCAAVTEKPTATSACCVWKDCRSRTQTYTQTTRLYIYFYEIISFLCPFFRRTKSEIVITRDGDCWLSAKHRGSWRFVVKIKLKMEMEHLYFFISSCLLVCHKSLSGLRHYALVPPEFF